MFEAKKKCSKCHNFKSRDEFHQNKTTPDGLAYWCKQCKSKFRKMRYQSEYGEKEKQKNRIRNREKNGGITWDWYEQKVIEQESKCFICNKHSDNLNIDHCHVTLKTRGLLCRHCNSMLGFAFDDPNVLRKGADYLEQHKINDS